MACHEVLSDARGYLNHRIKDFFGKPQLPEKFLLDPGFRIVHDDEPVSVHRRHVLRQDALITPCPVALTGTIASADQTKHGMRLDDLPRFSDL